MVFILQIQKQAQNRPPDIVDYVEAWGATRYLSFLTIDARKAGIQHIYLS